MMLKPRLLLCAMALWTLLASLASAQYLEAAIRLPDTLGPLTGPYHLAWDEDPAHPRLYVGGEGDSGGVIVAEAITGKRLARVSTGPVKALCFVPAYRKLYVARAGTDSVDVIDCATNRVVSMVRVASEAPVLQYNSVNDRLYCGGDTVSVLDCAGDSLVHQIAAACANMALDSADRKLYTGGSGPLRVIDCTHDSVVAEIPEVDSATVLCYNSTAGKVYARSGDTLFAVAADGDSVVARLYFSGLAPTLACDPTWNRIYCGYSNHWARIDCTADTVALTSGYLTTTPEFIACNAARDMLYIFRGEGCNKVYMFDASTGEPLTQVWLDGVPPGGDWSSGLNRLYCLPLGDGTGYSCCLLSAVDGTGDSIDCVVPLTVRAENLAPDTVHNRLYFSYGSSACGCIGIVDCARNVVTSYEYGGASPYAMCYNPNNDRLYWRSGGYSLTVYDCSTHTKVKKMNVSGDIAAMSLHLGLNKLYVLSFDSQDRPFIDVVDCDGDSVIKAVQLPYGGFMQLLQVPEDNTLWYLCVRGVVAIDCVGDSIVASEPDTLGSIEDACACPDDRWLYTGGPSTTVRSINMNKPPDVETLHNWIPGAGSMHFLKMPAAHKAYWTVTYSPASSHWFAIDTRTNTLTDSFWVCKSVADMCLDRSGNYIYGAMPNDTFLTIVDTRADSMVALFGLPPMIVAEKNPLAVNRATNNIYVAQCDVYTYGGVIPVIRDSIPTGLEELAPPSLSGFGGQTIVGRETPIRVSAEGQLWDASGRRAAVLHSGPNDISHLAPGVYFVRQGLGTRGEGLGKTRKVVVTR